MTARKDFIMGLFSIFKKKKVNEEVKTKPQAAPKTEAIKTESLPKEKQNPESRSTPKANTAPAPKTKPATEQKPKATPKAMPTTEPAQKAATKAEAKTAPKKESNPQKAAPVGKFEIKKSKDDRYVFNLYAANKVIVATSQVYSSSSSAMNGLKSVIENAEKASVEDQTLKSYETLSYPKWEIYQDKGGQYRFRLNASNGSCICHSQGYTTKASCKNGIDSIIKTAKTAVIDKSYLKKE